MKKKVLIGFLSLSLALQPAAVCMAGTNVVAETAAQERSATVAEDEVTGKNEEKSSDDTKKTAAETENTDSSDTVTDVPETSETKEAEDNSGEKDSAEMPGASESEKTDKTPEESEMEISSENTGDSSVPAGQPEQDAEEAVTVDKDEETASSDIAVQTAQKTYQVSSTISATLLDGMLTVSGAGAMPDYTGTSQIPWYNEKNEITKIVISEGITQIGSRNFLYCVNVTEVSLPNTLKVVGEAAFYQNSGLTEITIPDQVTQIKAGAFTNCYNLSSIHPGKQIKTIEQYAFQSTAVVKWQIPASVTEFDTLAFFGDTKLEELNVEAGNKNYASQSGVLYSADKKELLYYPLGKTASTYTIPNGTTKIGSSAFLYNQHLKNITIPKTVTSIEDWAFSNSALETLTVPDSVTSLGYGIASDCTSLRTAVIGNGVTKLEYSTFSDCTSLTKVTLGKNIKELYNRAFYGCSALTSVNLPENLETIRVYAFADCTALKTLTIPETVKEIEAEAFYNCTNLQVTYPSGLTRMEDGSYRYIQKLYYSGTYHYADAWQVLEIVNKERASAGLSALKMDQDLLNGAMQRAAETYLDFSHTRPSGQSCTTAAPGKAWGENIAAGNSTAAATMKQWMNSSGHRANILNSSYTSIGIGCFEKNGRKFWVQLFGQTTPGNVSKPADKKVTATISIEPGTYAGSVTLSWTDYGTATVQAGKTRTLRVGIKNLGWPYMTSYPDPGSFTWTSSNPKVATVDKNGNVKGISKGSATITVTGGGFSKSVTVAVNGSGNASYDNTATFDLKNFTLKVKKSYKLHVQNLSSGVKVKSWKSSNTKVAKVSTSGKVTAQKKTGKVTITATLSNGKKVSTTVKVQKGDVKTTKLTVTSPKTLNLKVKKTAQIKAVRTPVTCTQSLKYSSSNKKIATVNSKGKITAKKAGKATITVKSGSKKVKITVKVTK